MPSGNFEATVSADIESQASSISDAQAGTGTLSIDTVGATCSIGQNGIGAPTYEVYQGFFEFDISSIPVGATIDSATFSLESNGDNSTTNFTMNLYSFSWGSSLTAADFVPASTLSGLTVLATRGMPFTLNQFHSFTENSSHLRGAITSSLGGSVRFVVASDRQVSGVMSSGNEYVNASGHAAADPPLLEISWTVPPYERAVSGSISSISGNAAKRTNTTKAGVITGVGTVTKHTTSFLAGTMGALTSTVADAFVKVAELSGAITSISGGLGNFVYGKAVSGVVTGTGTVTKAITTAMAGTMGALSGAFSESYLYIKSLTGTLSGFEKSLTTSYSPFRYAIIRAGSTIIKRLKGGTSQ